MSLLIKNCLKVSLQKHLLKVHYLWGQNFQLQTFKTGNVLLSVQNQKPGTTQNKDAAKSQKKSKEVMITLLQNENMTVTALTAAKSLAKRRLLHLVKVQDMDTKTQRPVYKLLTAAEMLQNELDEVQNAGASDSASKKSEKTLNINARIAEHDLMARMKNISKWLNKQHEVRILIQASTEQDLGRCEKVFKMVDEAIKTPQVIGKIVQKRNKGSAIKFCILPLSPSTNDEQ